MYIRRVPAIGDPVSHAAADCSPDLAAQLYAEFREPLLSFFLRRVQHRSEAEDLTQDVFARLIRAGQLDRIENPHAFVFKIASNLLRDRGRAAGRAGITAHCPIDENTAQAIPLALVEDRSPESVLSSRKTLAEVFRALDELDARTRDIFVMFRLENMKQREIAALLGVAQSTVEKHVAKAGLHLLRRLRSK
ncbi:RNA polymerase sigma factor [Luteimonas sp. R10]|uniref:RNA polymerase sigma factor n=1 Tax=Luteimonas sp. R10 TaxID=3108176 RepID=UPI0030853201|nr:sigma-70 family RNA polymerase sigma factor [Luteimonas sp. R10]